MEAALKGFTSKDPKRAFACNRQLTRLRKKAKFDRVDLSIDTVCDFISLNRGLDQIRHNVDPEILNSAKDFILRSLENYTTSVRPHNVQISLDRQILLDLWGFGPGANASGSAEHPVEKYLNVWDCTADSLESVIKVRRSHVYLSFIDKLHGRPPAILTTGSRLSTVRKNEEKFRTICMEPIGNMALQLAAGKYLENTLRMLGLDIRKQQPLNKGLARRGSIDGSLATIDLSNASDMFTPELVRSLLPPEWFDLLMEIRSPACLLPDGSIEQLNMISTMGNGFTFPLMTFCLVALIYALRYQNGGRYNFVDWSSTGVFGDDIIIPSQEYEPFAKILEDAGLVVNHDKSFSTGLFRESCGGDYYDGYDVTPIYIKRLRSNADVYVAINQVFDWSGKHNCDLDPVLDLLFSYIHGKPLIVPEWCDSSWGVRSTLVKKNYKTLQIVNDPEIVENDFWVTPLVVGGFVDSAADDFCYVPRRFKPKYKIVKGRLPSGYLSGRSYPDRGEGESRLADLYLLIRDLVSS
jgi:hypothetical protein